MSAINSVTPVGGQVALQLLTKPSEGFGRDSAAPQPPANDTYTPGQGQDGVSKLGPGGAKAAEEYQRIGRLGSGNRNGGQQGEGTSAVQPQEGVNGAANRNEAVEAVRKVSSPNQVQQALDSITAKPDAALLSALSVYA